MTVNEINKHFGIPKQTLYGWRASAHTDWRYKLYQYLLSEEVLPSGVEKVLTSIPEIADKLPTDATGGTGAKRIDTGGNSQKAPLMLIKQMLSPVEKRELMALLSEEGQDA